MRTVVLHYHLFKNAGSSVDQILRKNFGDRWVTAEFPVKGGNNSAAVQKWIEETPDAVAFSTHTALGPIPDIPGTRIISVLFMRDPVARIRSAYRFERQQQSDSWGAQLAKAEDFDGYVMARLARKGDRQCRNFHASRLGSMAPGPGSEVDRAIRALELVSVIGFVERFDASMARLSALLTPVFEDFAWSSTRVNVTGSESERVDKTGAAKEAGIDQYLRGINEDDYRLLDAARTRFDTPY